MKVLILGSGGREHALAWATKKSSRVTEVVCAPGNGGIGNVARCVPVDTLSIESMVALAEAERPDLIIVGPEQPLSIGIVDALVERKFRVFGPTQAAAQLESSKGFAKEFMKRHAIPTANYAVCKSLAEVESAVELFHAPIVVKADGLHAGKGVIICESRATAIEAAKGLISGDLLGESESHILLEEFLTGPEISFLCLSDGSHVRPMVPSQDHKRIGEGDTGPNTGGMGVYSTDELLDPAMKEWIMKHIAEPTIKGMADEGRSFTGVLYCGLMMTPRGPQVLEYNARFGDPETQAILTRLDSDLIDAIEAAVDGKLDKVKMSWKPGASACVIASSAGYPGAYKKGLPISGLEEAEKDGSVVVFHAGSALKDGQIVTSGGRVLGATAAAPSLEEALKLAYKAYEKVHFEGIYFRRDIGHRALKK